MISSFKKKKKRLTLSSIAYIFYLIFTIWIRKDNNITCNVSTHNITLTESIVIIIYLELTTCYIYIYIIGHLKVNCPSVTYTVLDSLLDGLEPRLYNNMLLFLNEIPVLSKQKQRKGKQRKRLTMLHHLTKENKVRRTAIACNELTHKTSLDVYFFLSEGPIYIYIYIYQSVASLSPMFVP